MRNVPRCEPHLREADFACEKCDAYLCEDCVEHAWTGSGFQDLCRKCRTPAERLEREPAAEPGLSGFLARAPVIFRYPVRPAVLIALLGLSVFAWVTQFMGLIGWIFLMGATASLYFRMISRTSYGEEEFGTPGFSDIYEQVIQPIGLMLVVYLPLIASGAWLVLTVSDVGDFLSFADLVQDLRGLPAGDVAGPVLLAIAGFALLPLLTAIAALSRSALAILDPRMWWHALSIMRGTYAVYAALFYLVFFVEFTVWDAMLVQIGASLPIPVLTSVLVFMLGYLPMALRARIIGALCEPFLRDF